MLLHAREVILPCEERQAHLLFVGWSLQQETSIVALALFMMLLASLLV